MKSIMFKIEKNLCKDWGKYANILRKYEIVKIGDNCSISPKTSFGSEPYLIEIGNFVRISGDVQILTHDGGIHVFRQLYSKNIDFFGKVKIGNNVFIGTRSIIMPGVVIGNNCVIGAGSIVTKDIPDNTVYAGIPAKYISTIEQYYEKNKSDFDYTNGWTMEDKKNFLINKFNLYRDSRKN